MGFFMVGYGSKCNFYLTLIIFQKLLDAMPKVKLFFKTNKGLPQNSLPMNFSSNNYTISFDHRLFELHIISKDVLNLTKK